MNDRVGIRILRDNEKEQILKTRIYKPVVGGLHKMTRHCTGGKAEKGG
jgi:hypothetical protein